VTEAQASGGEHLMNKTIALTFTAAALLLAASFALNIYGHHAVESQRAAFRLNGLPTYYDHYETRLDSWERASGLIGLLAVSVTAAGAMLWHKEMWPQAGRGSILGLCGEAAKLTAGTMVPRNNTVGGEWRGYRNSAISHEEAHLTPLERVIRGS
jgi:hypothetical protein